jgi:hypothetical protein
LALKPQPWDRIDHVYVAATKLTIRCCCRLARDQNGRWRADDDVFDITTELNVFRAPRRAM